MSTLLVIRGPGIGIRYDLGDSTRIGRGPENEIQIADPNVSRFHAEIIRTRMSYAIHDRGSTNGVIVNGQPVPQKVLLRNDEIAVGNTVFLFNSDLQMRNARFSDNTVYLYPANEATVQLARGESTLSRLSGSDRQAFDFIIRLADMLSGPGSSLADISERLVSSLIQILMADTGILLLRDARAGDLRPVIALPANSSMRINRGLLATCAEEMEPFLASEDAMDLPHMNGAATPTGGEEPQPAALSTICAPIVEDDRAIGVLAVQKNEESFFTLRDLGLLHAVARLSGGLIAASQMAERAASATHDDNDEAGIVASASSQVRGLFVTAGKAADSDVTVLITGETGTGKEVLARYIHDHSSRRDGPFVAVNCGAIPATLFESELFGYERGAFTGAAKTTIGKIESAHGGTIFLDEIGELGPEVQPKLLRFLQEKAFFRVGATRAIDADVRIIAATNTDLLAAVREGRFREDLWYRLNVIHLAMPALRERAEDIVPLAEHFVRIQAQRMGRQVTGIDRSAAAVLEAYRWPGNICELQNAVERAVLLAKGRVLGARDFAQIAEAARDETHEAQARRRREIVPLAEQERRMIVAALHECQWNQARAAEALGIHRNTLRNKIQEYAIREER